MADALPRELETAFSAASILAYQHLSGEDAKDAEQEARLAIWQAWLWFDRSRGLEFITYAWHRARGAVLHYRRNQGRAAYERRRKGLPVPAPYLQPVPLDRLFDDETREHTAGALCRVDITGGGDGIEPALEWLTVRQVLDPVDRRLARLLSLRFRGGLTQAQVAERLGISQFHTSRLERKALALLRAALSD